MMQPEDLITVVIPVYNRPSMAVRAVESVLAQTDARWELIVVDDGSTDATPEILRRISSGQPRMKIVSQPNRGVSAARNAGIETSQGGWIAPLDSDDLWYPDKLQRQRAWLIERPEFRIAQCDERWVRNDREIVRPKHLNKKSDWIFEESLLRCMITPSTSIFEKALWREVGGFDEDLPACEDYDFWLRIAYRLPVGLMPFVGADRHAGHDDQLSERFEAMDRFRVHALDKLLKGGELNPSQRDSTQQVLAEKCRLLIAGAEKRGKTEDAERYRAILAR